MAHEDKNHQYGGDLDRASSIHYADATTLAQMLSRRSNLPRPLFSREHNHLRKHIDRVASEHKTEDYSPYISEPNA